MDFKSLFELIPKNPNDWLEEDVQKFIEFIKLDKVDHENLQKIISKFFFKKYLFKTNKFARAQREFGENERTNQTHFSQIKISLPLNPMHLVDDGF